MESGLSPIMSGRSPMSTMRGGSQSPFFNNKINIDSDSPKNNQTQGVTNSLNEKNPSYWPSTRWEGDFSQERYEAFLTNKMNRNFSLKKNQGYTDSFFWDRGGVCTKGVPYKLPKDNYFNNQFANSNLNQNQCQGSGKLMGKMMATLGSTMSGSGSGGPGGESFNTTNITSTNSMNSTNGSNLNGNGGSSSLNKSFTKPLQQTEKGLPAPPMTSKPEDLPTLLDYPEGSISTTRTASRLPILQPDVKKYVVRSQSCLELSKNCIFNGELVSKKMLLPPQQRLVQNEGKEMVVKKSRSERNPDSPTSPKNNNGNANIFEYQMSPQELLATRKLWQEAATVDAYFKTGGGKKSKDSGPALDGSVPGIDSAISKGGNINWPNPSMDGMTLFMHSIANNDINLFKYLFNNYYRPEFLYAVDLRGRSIFHHAALRGSAHCLTYLLRNLDVKKIQSIIHARDELGNTALHYAAHYSELVIVELLFKASNQYTPLEMVSSMRNNNGLLPYDLHRDFRALGGGRLGQLPEKMTTENFSVPLGTGASSNVILPGAQPGALVRSATTGQLNIAENFQTGLIRGRTGYMSKTLHPVSWIENSDGLYSMLMRSLNSGKGKKGGDNEDEEEEEEEEEEEDEGDDDDEDGEVGGGSAVKGKFKNLNSMDRRCNQDKTIIVKNKKKKTGGKKKKKK